MPTILVARIAAATVLATSLAACTSSGSGSPGASSSDRSSSSSSESVTRTSASKPTTGNSVLVGRADRVCATGNAYRKAHPFPFARFDTTNPDVADLPRVAAYLRQGPDVAGRLLALDLPLDVATALTRQQTNVQAQIAAARKSDPKAFARAARAAKVVSAQLLKAATRAGLGTASACLTYFRD